MNQSLHTHMYVSSKGKKKLLNLNMQRKIELKMLNPHHNEKYTWFVNDLMRNRSKVSFFAIQQTLVGLLV